MSYSLYVHTSASITCPVTLTPNQIYIKLSDSYGRTIHDKRLTVESPEYLRLWLDGHKFILSPRFLHQTLTCPNLYSAEKSYFYLLDNIQ